MALDQTVFATEKALSGEYGNRFVAQNICGEFNCEREERNRTEANVPGRRAHTSYRFVRINSTLVLPASEHGNTPIEELAVTKAKKEVSYSWWMFHWRPEGNKGAHTTLYRLVGPVGGFANQNDIPDSMVFDGGDRASRVWLTGSTIVGSPQVCAVTT